MHYPGCGQNILFITTNISLLVKMFTISNPTIGSSAFTVIFLDCSVFVKSILIILFLALCNSSSLISHSTHNCDHGQVPASARGLTAPFLIWHQPPARILSMGTHSDSSTPSLIWTERSSSPTVGVKIRMTCTSQQCGSSKLRLHRLSAILKLCWTCCELK